MLHTHVAPEQPAFGLHVTLATLVMAKLVAWYALSSMPELAKAIGADELLHQRLMNMDSRPLFRRTLAVNASRSAADGW